MALTISSALLLGNPHFWINISYSSSVGTSWTLININLFINAWDNSFLPPYPSVGFWVAKILKLGWALIVVWVSTIFNSLLSSNNLLRASSTSEGARFNSSKITQYPFLTASTNTPS